MEGHAARMKLMRNSPTILFEKPEGRNHLEDLEVDGKIILI
jgi:hypothetical protein